MSDFNLGGVSVNYSQGSGHGGRSVDLTINGSNGRLHY